MQINKPRKIIIGLVGEMGAGKTTATNYLKQKYGAVSFRFSDALRDVLNRLHLEHTRENLQTLSTFFRQNFGEDILSKILAEDVKKTDASLIITEGIRRPTDVTYLKALDNFFIVALNVDERARYERIVERSENPDDHSKTWEQFQAEGRQEAEQKIAEIAAEATETIDNNGSLENLYRQLDGLVTRYQ